MLEGPPKKRRSGAWILPLFILSILGGLVYLAFTYGSAIHEYFFDAPEITLVKGRLEQYDEKVDGGETSSKNLYAFLADAKSILESLETRYPADPRVPYFHGLFDLYEFQLRVPLNEENLLSLINRGYLPGARNGYSGRPITGVATSISRYMRKALAIAPDFSDSSRADLAILYGDLFDLGRTDPYMLDLIREIPREKIPPRFMGLYSWMFLSLESILGDPERIAAFLKLDDDSIGLKISPQRKSLILAQAYFYRGNYLQSLRLARSIKRDLTAPVSDRVEATRLEAEVFYVQRGAPVALYFFNEALAISGGNDPFIKERIEQIRLDHQQ